MPAVTRGAERRRGERRQGGDGGVVPLRPSAAPDQGGTGQENERRRKTRRAGGRTGTGDSLHSGESQVGAPPEGPAERMGSCSATSASTSPTCGQAAAYYRPLMPLLDYEPFLTAEDALAFMPAAGQRGAYLFLYEATEDRDYTRGATGLQHLAFVVPTRGAVRAVHAHVARCRQHRPAPAPGVAAVPAALLRHVLARSVRHHARGRVPPRP